MVIFAPAVPVVYYVGGIAFGSLAAAYAYWRGDELKDSLVDGIDYVTGNEPELVTLEELGYGSAPTNDYKTYGDSFYNNDKPLKDIKADKDAFTNVDNYRSSFVGENVIPNNTTVVKLDEKVFEAPQVKSELNDVVLLQKNKDTMIKTKEWDKLGTLEKQTYDNQIKVKENKVVNHIKQTNPIAVKDNVVQIQEKEGIKPTVKTFPGSITQKETTAIETKPLVNAPNVKESLVSNQLAQSKTVTQADTKSVAVADTVPIEPGSVQGPPYGEVNPVDIVDNKDTSVGVQGESDAVEGTKKAQTKRGKTKTVVSTRNIGENVLYGLEPSTYEFQLSALTKTQYASGNFRVWSNRRIIIKTSGLPEEGPELAPGTQLNYHIRNVSLSSTIGLNSATITSNVHNIRFIVFEPFGASLLDDLHDAAVQAGHKNYQQGIYLLKLKFYGPDDEGRPSDAGVEKYFPMKIIQCNFNVTGGGTEYEFEAVPYNANTLEDNRAKITQPINLKGATVGELLFNLQDQLNEQPKIKKNKEGYDLKIAGKPFKYGSTPGVADTDVEGYNIGLFEGTPQGLEKVPFSDLLLTGSGEDSKLATDLFKSTMNHDAFSSSANKVTEDLTPEGKLAKKEFETLTGLKTGIKFQDKYTIRTYTYNTGTPVLSIIQGIIDSSDYIMRQFKTEDTMNVDVNAYGEVPWYKIDYKWVDANESETPNKFIVRPYWVDQYVAMPDTDPKTKLNVKEVAREYNYIYTGENRDILNFDLQYNFAFFAAVAAQADKTPGGTDNKIAQDKVVTKQYGMGGSEEEDKAADKGLAVIESKFSDVDGESEYQGGERGNVAGYKTASIIKKQLSDPQADLINLEIDILGDPFYLVQEDFNPNIFPRSEANAYELSDGSIDANTGQVYLKINFKTPVDFDEDTGRYGGLQGSGKYDTSFFGGFYRLISVTSNFEEGRFTQQLQMVRCRHQQLEQSRLEIGQSGTTVGPAGSGVIPTTGGEFSTNSKITTEDQTEANIFDGLYVDKIVRSLGYKSGSQDVANNNLSANSGGTTNEKTNYSNATDNILSSNTDRTHTQTSTITGLTTGSSFGGELLTSSNALTEQSIGRGTGSTVGPGGASVATNTVTSTVGNKTTTKKTVVEGNSKTTTVTEEQTTGGNVTVVRSDLKKTGTDKYGGLTREEYYEGKTLVGLDQASGLELVDVSTADAAFRGFQRVRDECRENGGGKSECHRKAKEWKVANGYATKKKSKSGRDIYVNTYEPFDRTRQAR